MQVVKSKNSVLVLFVQIMAEMEFSNDLSDPIHVGQYANVDGSDIKELVPVK